MVMNLSKKLDGKTALVTGASKGIGRAIALKLAFEGATIGVHYNGSADGAREVLRQIEESGGRGVLFQANLSQMESVERLANEVESAFGSLDILVNNAGWAEFKPMGEITESDFDSIFDLNVKAVFFLTQAVSKFLKDGGRIITISSGITRVNVPNGSVYTGSKSAIEGFTKSWAAEFGPRQITVNVVSPGMTETELLLEVTPKERLDEFALQTPLGRLGKPQDIADVVAFLCSEEARWLTAQNLLANGGAA